MSDVLTYSCVNGHYRKQVLLLYYYIYLQKYKTIRIGSIYVMLINCHLGYIQKHHQVIGNVSIFKMREIWTIIEFCTIFGDRFVGIFSTMILSIFESNILQCFFYWQCGKVQQIRFSNLVIAKFVRSCGFVHSRSAWEYRIKNFVNLKKSEHGVLFLNRCFIGSFLFNIWTEFTISILVYNCFCLMLDSIETQR